MKPATGAPSRLAAGRKFARVAAYALAHWPSLAAILALTFAFSALAALQPWPIKLLVDYGLAGQAPPGGWPGGFELGAAQLVLAAALACLLLFGANSLLEAGLTWAWSAVGQRMVQALAADLFGHLQRLSLLFHARRPVGDSITRITQDSWSVYSVTDGLVLSPVRHLLTVAAVGAVAWQLDPALCLLTLAVAPLLAGSALFFGHRLKDWEARKRAAQGRIAGFLQQVLGALPLVQTCAAGPRNRELFGRLAADAVQANRGAALVSDGYAAANEIGTGLGTALVLLVGGRQVLAGELSLGSLLVFLAYLRTLEQASRGLLATYGKLRAAEASVDRVLEVLDSRDAVRESPGAYALPALGAAGGAERHPIGGGRLSFEQVSFAYPAGPKVLHELSLELAPGETLALVGPSGAGKSTLAALALRFFDPSAGVIRLDGHDLRELKLASLRENIAVVLQEPFLLPLSVADNIAYGRPAARREEIVAAAVAANADRFIRALPAGYDTVLGEAGATLSGGQRQRLAIARALLKPARLLILDEPTSALDPSSEAPVVEALGRLVAGRSTLIIAHRLSTLRRADRVGLLERGRLVELGTPAELLAAGGRFAELYALQAVAPPALAGSLR